MFIACIVHVTEYQRIFSMFIELNGKKDNIPRDANSVGVYVSVLH